MWDINRQRSKNQDYNDRNDKKNFRKESLLRRDFDGQQLLGEESWEEDDVLQQDLRTLVEGSDTMKTMEE